MGTKSSKKIAPKQKARAPLWLWLIIAAGVALIAFVVIDSASRSSSTPATAPQVSGAPRLAADKEKIDLGDVKLGQTVSVSFELTNVGDRALQFTASPYIEVKAGC